MNYYPCPLCPASVIVNTDRKFLYFHLRSKHLIRDVTLKIVQLRIIEKPYRESNHSLINSLIDYSKFRSMS